MSDWSPGRADEIVDYLLGPRLWIPRVDYPDFGDWVQKVHSQLKSGEKRALVALSYTDVVGVAVYQRHLSLQNTLEIKNISVRPDARGRHVASFLLRNAEVEGARDFKVLDVRIDAKAKNLGIRTFLFRNGYASAGTEDLYGLGAGDDVLYRKRIRL